jgi:hypothetical protein
VKANVRAAVAAVALSHSTGKGLSSIYAYAEGRYQNISMRVSGNNATGYDYSSGSYIGGNFSNLYHYGEGSHINFQPKSGGRYIGYDYGSGFHFIITVRGISAQLYDYGEGIYFSYSA